MTASYYYVLVMNMEIHPEVASLAEACAAIRQSLHRIPEPGFEEVKTGAYIREFLRQYPPDSVQTLARTGIKAVYYAQNATETVAFRSDIDGLGVQEKCDVPYRSLLDGRMHACGHDGHMTMLLLLARLLHQHRERLGVNVVLLFQPAEEGKCGARRMVEDGALRDPHVDRIYGMHLWPNIPKGRIGVRWGPMMAQACEFDVVAYGVSSHGASPQMGVDAIVAAATLITMLQSAITRNVDPLSGALLTIGKISGGAARNIIADKVVMNATLRVFSEENYDQLMRRINAMAHGVAEATSARFEINELQHYPCVDNPRALVEDFYRYIDMSDIDIAEPVLIAEDFSCYQKEIPGLFLFLGVGGGKNSAPLHNPLFDFDEDALLYGVEVYRRLLGI